MVKLLKTTTYHGAPVSKESAFDVHPVGLVDYFDKVPISSMLTPPAIGFSIVSERTRLLAGAAFYYEH